MPEKHYGFWDFLRDAHRDNPDGFTAVCFMLVIMLPMFIMGVVAIIRPAAVKDTVTPEKIEVQPVTR